ncbi:MAG TPA: LacI family DNA-binding transcriptional regulator [Symbiobacteriaceae bacterium]|nr:LacI family DNA-binding transcriptional regulator [Symbiobacteriaceae bacterium]
MTSGVTIREVAKRAGVSIATVSAVLNQSAGVSDLLRERVLDAVQELDYKPNFAAQSLRSRRSRLLGIILTDIRNPFVSEVAVGFEEGATSLGYQVVIHNTGDEPGRVGDALQNLKAAQVAGLVVATALAGDVTLLDHLQGLKVPYVFINRTPYPGVMNYVGSDNVAIGQTGTRHLLSLGHRKIACITGSPQHSTSWERHSGYLQAMAEAGIDVPNGYVHWGSGFHEEAGYKAAESLMRLPDRPTAMLVTSDLMALGAVKAVQAAGLRVPEDVAVVGVDNISLSDSFIVPLTTVHQPKREMGLEAAKMLIGLITGKQNGPTSVILPPKLVVRQSCGAVCNGIQDKQLEPA